MLSTTLAALLLSCAGTEPGLDTGPAPPDVMLQVGGGHDTFVEASQGVELVFGPQGSWHLTLSIRGCGIDPPGALNLRGDLDGERVCEAEYELSAWLEDPDPRCGVASNLFCYVPADIVDPEAELVGTDVTLSAVLVAEGAPHTATATGPVTAAR